MGIGNLPKEFEKLGILNISKNSNIVHGSILCLCYVFCVIWIVQIFHKYTQQYEFERWT